VRLHAGYDCTHSLLRCTLLMHKLHAAPLCQSRQSLHTPRSQDVRLRREAQVQLGVLQHLAGNAEEAWQELGHAAERTPKVQT
jgi:hypothetical protein